jgi:hypothetical protein
MGLLGVQTEQRDTWQPPKYAKLSAVSLTPDGQDGLLGQLTDDREHYHTALVFLDNNVIYCVEVLMRLRSFQFQEVINLQLQRLRHHLQVTVTVSAIFVEDLVHRRRFRPIPILHHSLWLQAVWQQDLELLNVVSLKHSCIQRLHCKSSLTYVKTVLPKSKDSPGAQRSSTKKASSTTPRQFPV